MSISPALQQAGSEGGLETLYFGEQYRFLMGLGFVEDTVALQEQETDPRRAQALRMTLKNLILPDGGMGETFKVLVQGKGVGRRNSSAPGALRDLPCRALLAGARGSKRPGPAPSPVAARGAGL